MLSISNEVDPLIFYCVCFVCGINYVFPTGATPSENQMTKIEQVAIVKQAPR